MTITDQPLDEAMGRRNVPAILLALLAVTSLVVLARPVVELPLEIGRNHNEGWNAHHASAVLHGERLYPATDAFTSNNYPPLSFYVLGRLGTLTGDALRAGRGVSLLSLLVVAGVMGWMARRLTRRSSLGVFASLLLLATMGAHFQNYVAMNDPQMLGHAAQYLGLALFLSRGDRRGGLIASAVLLALGGLVKHNLVAIPLAITVWLWIHRRRDLGPWLIASTLLVALSLAAIFLIHGTPALWGIFLHARQHDPLNFALGLHRWLVPLTPILGAILVAGGLRGRDPAVRLPLLICGFAAVMGAVMSLGAGVNYNAFFDLLFLACLLSAVAVESLGRHGEGPVVNSAGLGPGWVRPTSVVLFALPALLTTPLRLYELVEAVEERPARVEAARADLAWIEEHPGPLLCEDPALSYWTGRPFELGFFNYGQKLATGAVDGQRLWERLEAQHFAVIQTDRRDGRSALGAEFSTLLQRHYELERVSPVNGYFYRPRDPGP